MNRLIKYSQIVALTVIITSCFEKEVFPDVPNIAFEGIRFVDSDNTQDSLVLSFSFGDGDGDIGLDNLNDISPPFHFADAVLDGDTLIVTDTSDHNPPYVKAAISLLPRDIVLREGSDQRRVVTVTEFQRVSDFELLGNDDPRIGQSECLNYQEVTFFFPEEVAPETDQLGSTTISAFILPNETYYNLLIEFYEQLSDGTERIIDFNTIFNACTDSFNGRIPFFGSESNQGTITYSMKSNGFRLGLGGRPIRIAFQVIDRDLNRSNLVSTDYFFLEDITQ